MGEVNVRRREVRNKENEVTRVDDNISNYRILVENEEKSLDDQLRIVKDELHHLKNEQRVDTVKLRRELSSKKTQLNEIKQRRKEDYLDGQNFLKHVAERTVTYLEDCTKYRDQASHAMLEAVNGRLKDLKRAKKEIDIRVTKALKESQNL